MHVEFGIFLDLPTDAGGMSVDRHVARYRPLLQLAERRGFTSAWAGESYPRQAGGFQHVPSPMLVLAALSGSTSMALGTGVTLVPAWDVRRLAYDGLIMDHLTGGRFSIGVGVGNAGVWKQFGLNPSEVGERTDEMLRALRALWCGEDGFEGRLVRVAGGIGPRPLRPGGPEIWVGGKIGRSARRAAELGDGYLAGTHFTLGQIEALVGRYRKALAGRGAEGAAAVSVNRLIALAEDPEAAWRECGPHLATLLRTYARLGMLPAAKPLLEAAPDDVETLRAVATPDLCLVGSPETVAPQIERYLAAGVGRFQLRPAPGGMPAELMARTLELAGSHLLPRFR